MAMDLAPNNLALKWGGIQRKKQISASSFTNLLLISLFTLSGCGGSSGGGGNEQDLGGETVTEKPINTTLDPYSPPSDNFDLSRWYIGVPVDENHDGKSDNIYEKTLNAGYEKYPYFYTNTEDGGMVFLSYVEGAKTSSNTSYTRSELRGMLRQGNTSIATQGVNKNNWVLGSAPAADLDKAGGIDGTLSATLAVNHVTTTGSDSQVGRVIIGQIHANNDEPIRLYYRKLPNHTKGSIYFAHEPTKEYGDERWVELIGSRSSGATEPEDGIALDEVFSYRIQTQGDELYVTISREGKADVTVMENMTASGYNQGDQYLYFKAGVYNQNNSGDAKDYVQATFYALEHEYGTP